MGEGLIIVDVQNDFIPGGALPVPRGDEVVDRVNELIDGGRFDLVVATRDWHPPDHGSFEAQGGPWPPHCVQRTEGAEIHAGIPRERIDAVIDKGVEPQLEGYSAFEGTGLEDLLHQHDIDRVTLVGLATDYCVKHTALDALGAGFAVTLDRAGVRGIDAQAGDAERALEEIANAGGTIR